MKPVLQFDHMADPRVPDSQHDLPVAGDDFVEADADPGVIVGEDNIPWPEGYAVPFPPPLLHPAQPPHQDGLGGAEEGAGDAGARQQHDEQQRQEGAHQDGLGGAGGEAGGGEQQGAAAAPAPRRSTRCRMPSMKAVESQEQRRRDEQQRAERAERLELRRLHQEQRQQQQEEQQQEGEGERGGGGEEVLYQQQQEEQEQQQQEEDQLQQGDPHAAAAGAGQRVGATVWRYLCRRVLRPGRREMIFAAFRSSMRMRGISHGSRIQ